MKNTRLFCRRGRRRSPGGGYLLLLPVLLVFSACSCSTDGSIQQILGKSVEAPVFVDCRPVSSTEIVFKFTLPVRVVSLNFDPGVEAESVEEGREVKVTLARPLEEGRKITADVLVEDSDRNSLNVIVPFRARNDRMPAMVFNELRTEYTKPKAEFVEFLTRGSGNLGALRLFIAGHSLSKPVYEFSPAEVRAGEYIVLHLRTVEEGCVDETGPNLNLSGGTDAQSTARDFWIPGSTRQLHKTDALWLMDQDDRIIDAIVLCEKSTEWGKNNSAAAAEFLGENGAWPADPASAVSSAGTANTRTICRDENLAPAPRAENWYITATSSATPGKPNSPKRYTP